MERLFSIRLLGLLIFSALSLNTFAQDQGKILKGKILDSKTKNGIPLVHVTNLSTGNLTSTDSTGRFEMEIKSFPVRIAFHHVAYYPDTISVATNHQFNNDLRGEEGIFFLRTNVFKINEVSITPGAHILFENEPYAIIDYQFCQNHIVLIGYRNYNELRKEVAVADLNGKITWSRPMQRIDEIYRDCLGDIYLVDNDSAHLAYIQGDTLSIKGSWSIQYFSDFIRPVQVVTDSLTIFTKTSPGKQYQNYFLIKGTNTEAVCIYQAGNIGKESRLKALDARTSYAFREVVKTNDAGTLEAMYRLAFSGIHEKQVDFKPVETQIFTAGDSLVLFDLTARCITRFSSKVDLYWKTPMQVIFNNDWAHKFHHDIYFDRYYLEFANGPLTYLVELDPVSGNEISQIPIPRYNHIDHIQVNKNRIWFLHQPDIGDRGKKLYYLDF